MIPNGYTFTKNDLAMLILQRFYPERTTNESAVIRDFLLAHGAEFDRFDFSVRVGVGATPDPSLPKKQQNNIIRSSRKRIDILAWRGSQPVIIKVKTDVTPASLGQIQTYRHLWLEENPHAPEPELIVVGRTTDDDTVRALQANGITVYLYPDANAA